VECSSGPLVSERVRRISCRAVGTYLFALIHIQFFCKNKTPGRSQRGVAYLRRPVPCGGNKLPYPKVTLKFTLRNCVPVFNASQVQFRSGMKYWQPTALQWRNTDLQPLKRIFQIHKSQIVVSLMSKLETFRYSGNRLREIPQRA
jgi:hypothetical protein